MVNGIIKFHADWCGPCKILAPRAEEIAAQLGVTLESVDIEANPDLAKQYGVRSIPYMVAFKDGAVVDTMVGAKKDSDIVDFFKKTL